MDKGWNLGVGQSRVVDLGCAVLGEHLREALRRVIAGAKALRLTPLEDHPDALEHPARRFGACEPPGRERREYVGARDGIDALEKASDLDEDAAIVKAFLAYAHAKDGQEAEARALVLEVENIWREQYTCAYEIALTHNALGDEEAAFQWLEQALADKAGCVPYMNVDRRWGSLRDHPRFQALLDEVAFDR